MVKVKTIKPESGKQLKYDTSETTFVNGIVNANDIISKKTKQIIRAIENGDKESAIEETKRAIFYCQKYELFLRSFPKVFGFPDAMSKVKMDMLEEENINFEILDGNVLHITLSELFPARYNGGAKMESYDAIRSKYIFAFEKFFKENPFQRYKERVVMLYKSNYTSESNMKDYDNYETKALTDFIATYCLIDDNPSRVLAMSDYEIKDEEYSEIYVIPISKFDDYSDMIFRRKD